MEGLRGALAGHTASTNHTSISLACSHATPFKVCHASDAHDAECCGYGHAKPIPTKPSAQREAKADQVLDHLRRQQNHVVIGAPGPYLLLDQMTVGGLRLDTDAGLLPERLSAQRKPFPGRPAKQSAVFEVMFIKSQISVPIGQSR